MTTTVSLRLFVGLSLSIVGLAQSAPVDQAAYGETEFQATGSREAHAVFLKGLLQLHNFEYPDARASFQEAQAINPDFVVTDQYVQGLVALNRGDAATPRQALAAIGATNDLISRDRRAMTPRLLHLALQAQIELAAGATDQALALMEQATELESSLQAVYGPAVPVQPMAELLADTYLALGDSQLAQQNYELALTGAVGRERSLHGLRRAAH